MPIFQKMESPEASSRLFPSQSRVPLHPIPGVLGWGEEEAGRHSGRQGVSSRLCHLPVPRPLTRMCHCNTGEQ